MTDQCNSKNAYEAFNTMLGFTPIPHPQLTETLYDGFLLPIEYLDKSQTELLSKTVMEDLELEKMETRLCKPTNEFGRILLPEMAKRHTTNIGFLQDTQQIIKTWRPWAPLKDESTKRFKEMWSEIKEDKDFLERHSYMEYVFLENLNQSLPFLNTFSVLNLLSPIYSLALPLILLLMPFVLLQIWRVPISFELYLITLRNVSKSHFIGKLINIQEMNMENILYILFFGGVYVMQTYNQVMYVIKYHNAIKRMNETLLFLREYLDNTIQSMTTFVQTADKMSFYSDFCQDIHGHKLVLKELRDLIGEGLTPYENSLYKVSQLGHMFYCYYQVYSSMEYEASLKYSVGFEGYLDLLRGIQSNITEGLLGKAEYVEEMKNTKIEEQFYPPLEDSHPITNTVDLSTNIIITGVNASGKTTSLKTTALNVIFSQQIGFGFYLNATIRPFKYIHSYLNIPDTSGRDSLFQAESRRCKEILDKIRDSLFEETHLVIFDELYSGTNPKEAIKSAYSLLSFLSTKPNVRFLLTTHYVDVCKKFKKSKTVLNYKMVAKQTELGEFIYTYKMRPGISTLEGGIAILKTMDYPAEILDNIEEK
jgi:hypothetical protein